MNYQDIATAYEAQATALLAMVDGTNVPNEVSVMVLELREKAQDCRQAHRNVERQEVEHKMRLEYDVFERSIRAQWLEAEQRKAKAFEGILAELKRRP